MAERLPDGRIVLSHKESAFFDLVHHYWFDEGPQPWYHRKIKKMLSKNWPTLYHALKGLLND